jgi:hypothetical protein
MIAGETTIQPAKMQEPDKQLAYELEFQVKVI